jgi:hypothetical protein
MFKATVYYEQALNIHLFFLNIIKYKFHESQRLIIFKAKLFDTFILRQKEKNRLNCLLLI